MRRAGGEGVEDLVLLGVGEIEEGDEPAEVVIGFLFDAGGAGDEVVVGEGRGVGWGGVGGRVTGGVGEEFGGSRAVGGGCGLVGAGIGEGRGGDGAGGS